MQTACSQSSAGYDDFCHCAAGLGWLETTGIRDTVRLLLRAQGVPRYEPRQRIQRRPEGYAVSVYRLCCAVGRYYNESPCTAEDRTGEFLLVRLVRAHNLVGERPELARQREESGKSKGVHREVESEKAGLREKSPAGQTSRLGVETAYKTETVI